MKLFGDNYFTGVSGFRAKLLLAMMTLSVTITGGGLYFAEHKVAAETEHDLLRDFQAEVTALDNTQEIRRIALAERCRALVRRPRIRAALEDNALDLLYPSAKDELSDVMEVPGSTHPLNRVLVARFYRFLDTQGAIIAPPNPTEVGLLTPAEEAQLQLPGMPDKEQLGYLQRSHADHATPTIDEVIVMPIISAQTEEVIAAVAVGFKPVELAANHTDGMKSGIWLGAHLHMLTIPSSVHASLSQEIQNTITAPKAADTGKLHAEINGNSNRLFFKQLNPGSLFPAAYQVSLYPVSAGMLARQKHLRWQATLTCTLLLGASAALSHYLARQLSQPVEKLVIVSAEERLLRERAEADLQRAARFSADASHQLKTPVTVLRAGLEELLALEPLSPEVREEISALVHQTFRLTSIVEDLLMLSQLDAGHLPIQLNTVNLTQLIDALVDDLSALPDELNVEVTCDCPTTYVLGERRYIALILQNLLENARKYNRQSGQIRIACNDDGQAVTLQIANTGSPIHEAAREHIFERFHRGTIGENVPGHGLGLNLARELARLHGGDLWLLRSDTQWTEFAVRFRNAKQGSTFQPTA